MMGVRVVIEWSGLEQVISNLADIEEKAPQNLEHQMAELAHDTEEEWKQNTPRRTGKLQDADVVEPDGLSFTMKNSVHYYPFVDEGHNTPRGWRTKHGYRPAKRRSHVEGREMTSKTIDFIEENLEDHLSKFLDNV
jgi:hypothetical protein